MHQIEVYTVRRKQRVVGYEPVKTIIRYFLRKTVISAMQDWQGDNWAEENIFLESDIRAVRMNMLA